MFSFRALPFVQRFQYLCYFMKRKNSTVWIFFITFSHSRDGAFVRALCCYPKLAKSFAQYFKFIYSIYMHTYSIYVYTCTVHVACFCRFLVAERRQTLPHVTTEQFQSSFGARSRRRATTISGDLPEHPPSGGTPRTAGEPPNWRTVHEGRRRQNSAGAKQLVGSFSDFSLYPDRWVEMEGFFSIYFFGTPWLRSAVASRVLYWRNPPPLPEEEQPI